jgi:hypothetical protein
MTKKDINYIKFIKPQIKQKENEMKHSNLIQKPIVVILNNSLPSKTNPICKESATMSARERLMNYAATGDGTYLGVGCEWDLLTQCGRDRFGRLL